MEAAIIKSIRVNTPLTQMGCWRHFRQDIQRWLADTKGVQRWLANNLAKVLQLSYIDDLFNILLSKDQNNCKVMIEEKKESWNPQFRKYFENNVEAKLEYFCTWSVDGECSYDEENCITNQSEGFNFLLKDFQNWKEVPLDSLLMSLKLIQGFYREECRQGKMGIGNYTLKSKYRRFRTDDDNFEPRTLVCHPKNVVKAIRNREFIAHAFENMHRNEYSSNSRILRASDLVAQDLIAFSSRLGAFTVMDSAKIHLVKLLPNETCSCPIKKSCKHILAIKLGLRTDMTSNDLSQNLGVVRKEVRGLSCQKPGWKHPRPEDFSVDIPDEEKLKKPSPKRNRERAMEQAEEQDMERATERDLEQTEERDMEHVWEQDMEEERDTEQVQEQDMEQAQERDMEHAWERDMEQEQDMEQTQEQDMEQIEKVDMEQAWEGDMEQAEEGDMEQAWKLNMKQAWKLGVEQAQERDMEQDMDITEEDEKIQRLSDLLKEISADKFMLSQFLKQIDISFDKVITSVPKSDIKRDTRYSLEVWIPADGMKLFHNLNIAEKKILKSKQWLNDIIIDSSMDLLQYQFPDLEGFHSCQLVYQLHFERHSKLFIQIINRSLQDGGSHWLTVSNINCLENTIKVYDSAYDDLPHEEEMVVASLVSTNANNLQVLFPNIALQTNGYDCGLYAIANATAFAYGMDPGTQVYIPKLMREHLFKCLEQKHLEPFPITNIKNRRKTLKNAIDVPLYCLCHMPDTGTMYIYCDTCASEYHPQCVGIDISITDSTQFTCPKCRQQ